MLSAIRRKAAQVISDPVLRRWLIARLIGREHGTAPGPAQWPPYLDGLRTPTSSLVPSADGFPECIPPSAPENSIELPISGLSIHLERATAAEIFANDYADMEHTFAVHRFAWMPLFGKDIDRAWVDWLWREWMARYRTPSDSPAWHPYTAAERAINVLEFAKTFGLPGEVDETLAVLVDHGQSILKTLEYFGETDTGNHLSNNGRGLYLLGLTLGIAEFADIGGRILITESERIFAPSGVLREGSSHYHLLLTRNYLTAWIAALEGGRTEEPALRNTAMRALSVLPHLDLPAGMPLIGDISPDCPPDFLTSLLPSGDVGSGWLGGLDDTRRSRILRLRDDSGTVPADRLAADGWHRLDVHDWSAFWYVSPDGWPPMPGHAHHDMTGFELRFRDMRLVIDPGRGAYGDTGDAATYVGAAVHSGLMIDGAEPYPQNRPYYSDAYRRRVCGPPPTVQRSSQSINLEYWGFSRLNGLRKSRREWRFAPNELTIVDTIEGGGNHSIVRTIHTPGRVERNGEDVFIRIESARFRLQASGNVSVEPATFWNEYGNGIPSSLIRIRLETELPAELSLTITLA